MSSTTPRSAPERTRELTEERREAREAEEAAVRPLLARANLLRIRRQWDEAIAVCTEALRRAPESATAHSLMGDIYEAQEKLDDAVQWYSMAVDLAPSNLSDREKLNRVVAVKRGTSPGIPAVTLSGAVLGSGHAASTDRTAVLPATDAARRTAGRTLDWFDRIFPPGRAEGVARMILALCAVLAALLVGLAGVLYVTMSRSALRDSGGANGQASLPRPPDPVRMEVGSAAGPSVRDGGLFGDKTASPGSAVRPSPSPVPLGTPAASTDADRLRTLRAALERALPKTLSLADVQYEPLQVRLNCDLLVALGTDESVEKTREQILRAAVFVGRTAILQDPQIQRVALRVRAKPGSGGTDAPDPGPLFLGETSAALLREADPVTGSDTQFASLFSYAWWSPSLSLEPSASPGPEAPPPVPVTP